MKLIRLSNLIINFFLVILVVVSIIGAIVVLPTIIGRSSKLIVLISIVLIMLIAFIGTYWGKSVYLAKKIRKFIVLNKRVFLVLFFLVTILWQFMIVMSLAGSTTWDPSIIVRAAAGHSYWVKDYFSFYPNTLLLLFFEHFVYIVAGHPRLITLTKILNIINLLLLDTSLLILFSSLKKTFGKKISVVSAFFFWTLIVISLLIAIPYSDIWALFFSTITLAMGYRVIRTSNFGKKGYLCLGLGTLLAISYLVKPSLMVYMVAWILMGFVEMTNRKISKKHFFILIIFVILPLIIIPVFNSAASHTSLVKVEKERAMTLTHYMAMGLAQGGGYNEQDVLLNEKIKDQSKRNQMNINLIKERLHEKQVLGYTKFLFNKQISNTSDATFGWRNDGGEVGFLIPYSNSKNPLIAKIQKTYVSDTSGKDWSGNSLIVQSLWIVVLLCILATLPNSQIEVQLLKYVVSGGMIFLLLFEGGRSRYLIQFLPFITTLAGIGFVNIVEIFKNNIYYIRNVRKDEC